MHLLKSKLHIRGVQKSLHKYNNNIIDHIAHIKNKISRGIGIITRVTPFVNKRCISNLYHAFINPYLLYYLEVWGNY